MQDKPWYLQEQIVRNYEFYYETKYKRADALEKKLLNKLLKHFDGTGKLLEVGCGTGHFARWMETLGFESYGLDLSAFMLKEAKRLWHNGPVLQGDSGHLPFKTGSFDFVVFVACLEYMPDIAKVFVEAARIARKGIIIGLMNKWSAPTIRRMIQVRMGKNPYYKNARFYSISDMKRILHNVFGDKYAIVHWTTTVFAKIFGEKQSALFPFGAFLGIAVKLSDERERIL